MQSGEAESTQPDVRILELLIDMGVQYPVNNKKECTSFILNGLNKIFSQDSVKTLKDMVANGLNLTEVEMLAQRSLIGKSLRTRYDCENKVVKYLLSQGCSINALNSDMSSPLVDSLESENYAFTETLLDSGVEITDADDLANVLAECVELPKKLLPRLLLNQDLDKLNAQGLSPIQLASQYGNTSYASYLVKKGADINKETKHGSPLVYAIATKAKGIAALLIKSKADVNVVHPVSGTALDLARTLPGFKAITKQLIEAGAKTRLELEGGDDYATHSIDSIMENIHEGEAWANLARKTLSGLGSDEIALWDKLTRHCLDNNSSKPSKRWLKEATSLANEIGNDALRERLLEWFPVIKDKRTGRLNKSERERWYGFNTDHIISENNTRLLKGLIWLASRFDDDVMSRTLRDVAKHMYKKVPDIGMRNAKLGNAAILSLSMMPGTVGLKEIIVLRASTKYNPALVNINRIFTKLAETREITPDELAEISIPDYGLTDIGEYKKQVGDFEAHVKLISVGKCELLWSNGKKTQKSVPAAIKVNHASEIKEIKALVKEVQTGCSAHSLRLENMYLRDKTLDFETWSNQYINHRLIGFLARRLIWRVTNKDGVFDVIYNNGSFIDSRGETIDISADSSIQLWHPSMSAPQAVLDWRRSLIDNEITQPFKQAYREIYLLTDAERETCDHSLRFANHILKHHQFHALALQRGWQQTIGGQWDGGSENAAYKEIPVHNLGVCFEAQGMESYDFTDSGIYECVGTSEVTFTSEYKRLELKDIDPLIFSEVMRDIDLFVGVTSIGNDPDWREREAAYWDVFSFGELTESASMRKEVLTALIPKLAIADQLTIEGRFLVVKGSYTVYRIHLGSSNIQMEPNNSYLCIVPKKTKSTISLPFEGDSILSLILSKAMMLAADNKIKDDEILSQININR